MRDNLTSEGRNDIIHSRKQRIHKMAVSYMEIKLFWANKKYVPYFIDRLDTNKS